MPKRVAFFKGPSHAPGGDIPTTVFAGDDELLAFLHHEPLDGSSIGEDMVKAYTRDRGELVESVERCAIAPPYPFG